MSCEIQPARHNHQQGTEKTYMAWPILTKNANFGPNLVVFGQKILFFTSEIKSFVTHIREAIISKKCSFLNIVQKAFDPPPFYLNICPILQGVFFII